MMRNAMLVLTFLVFAGCGTIWDEVRVVPGAIGKAPERLAQDLDECRLGAAIAGQAYAAGQPRDLAIAGAVAGGSLAGIAGVSGALARSRTTVAAAGIAGAAVGLVGAVAYFAMEAAKREVMREAYGRCLRARGYEIQAIEVTAGTSGLPPPSTP